MKKISLMLMLAMMSGCSWLGSGDDEGETSKAAALVDFTQEVDLKKLWSISVGNGQETHLTSLAPVLNGDKIYAADGEGDVVAVNALTGKKLWSVELDDSLSGGVGIGGGMVFVGSHEGHLYALNAVDGVRIWQATLSSEILSRATSDGSTVAVQTVDGKIFGLDAKSGEQLWFYEAETPILTLYGTSSPLISKNLVVAGFANGKVMAFEADNGGLVWEGRLTVPRGQTELDRLSDIDGELLLQGEILYVSGYRGSVVAMSRATGRTLWTQSSSSYHGVAVQNSRLFVVDEKDSVIAMRSSGGQKLWSNAELRNRQLTMPLALQDSVAVADKKGYLHILSGKDGRVIGRTKVDGSGVHVPMTSDGDVLFVQDNDGDLTAYRIN